MIFGRQNGAQKKPNQKIFSKFDEKPQFKQEFASVMCRCKSITEINNNQVVCLDCGAINEKIEDICLEDRKLIRNQMGQRPLQIGYDLAKYLNWKRFQDDVILRINTAEKYHKKPKIPQAIIEQSFADLKELWDTISIKGKNPERVFAYRLLTLCDQQGLQYSKKYITAILDIKDGKIQQGIKIYSDFEIQKGQQNICKKTQSPILSHHKSFEPTEKELQYSQIIIQLFDNHHIFMQSVDSTKGKKVVTLLQFMRIKQQQLYTDQHIKHTKKLTLKFGTCWKCLVALLKNIDSDIRQLKEVLDAIQLIKFDLEQQTNEQWEWINQSLIHEV